MGEKPFTPGPSFPWESLGKEEPVGSRVLWEPSPRSQATLHPGARLAPSSPYLGLTRSIWGIGGAHCDWDELPPFPDTLLAIGKQPDLGGARREAVRASGFLEDGRTRSRGHKAVHQRREIEQRLERVLLEQSHSGQAGRALQRTVGESVAWGHRRRVWPAGSQSLTQGGTSLRQEEPIQTVL